MTHKINRRQFIKETISNTTAISVGYALLPLTTALETEAGITCGNCRALNVKPSILKRAISPSEQKYCKNCGVEFDRMGYNYINCTDPCIPSSQKTYRVGVAPACCDIPFPNGEYVKNSDKPNLALKDVLF